MTFREDLKRPFNLISLTLAVLGIGLSIYLYFNPRAERRISFLRSDTTKVYDSHSSTSNLRVTDASGSQIASDVSVVAFTIWNSGSQPIEPSDVRKPLKIINRGVGRILDATIVRRNDGATANFEVGADLGRYEAPDRTVTLSWLHFDPNQGVKIQIAYAGNESANFDLAAQIVGVTEVQRALVLGPAKWVIAAAIFGCVGAILYFVRELAAVQSPIRWLMRNKDFAPHFTEAEVAHIERTQDFTSVRRQIIIVIYLFIFFAALSACVCIWLLAHNQAAPF
ncbi:MAG: hypothetical protein ABJB97_12215 [Acidobacteriota bacterium]